MIDSIRDCTVNQYIKCMFDKNYSVLGEGTEDEKIEAFKKIQLEYTDLSGGYESENYETTKDIIELSSRVEKINILLYLEYQCLKEFGKPYAPAFEELKRYGYNLEWLGDLKNFIFQLENIRSNEIQFIVKLAEAKVKIEKEIENENKTRQAPQRIDFIKLIIRLQKGHYPIDRDKTTMEEFAINISELRELTLANKLENARNQ